MEELGDRAARYVAALKSCLHSRCLQRVKMIHRKAVTNCCCNIYVENTLIDVYGRCGAMVEARNVFNSMVFRNVVSWNSLIQGYANNGESEQALEVFYGIEGFANARTYVAALAACGSLSGKEKIRWLEKGKSIHSKAQRHGFCANKFVQNVLVDMYAKLGDMEEANKVFNAIADPDVVSWTSLLQGYVRNGDYSLALELFDAMTCSPNERTYIVALKACTSGMSHSPSEQTKWLNKAKAVHRLSDSNHVHNTLIDMYGKCGIMSEAQQVFDSIHPDVVSWNALLQGYVNSGEPHLALELYDRMKGDGYRPDARTYVVALTACAALATRSNGSPGRPAERNINWLNKGRSIHLEITMHPGCSDVFVETALVNMYAKFGDMKEARTVFDKMPQRNVVSWNSTIQGYVDNGESSLALELVLDMHTKGIKFNAATFVAAIKACEELMASEACRAFCGEIYRLGLEQDVRITTSLMDFYGRSGNTNLTSYMFDSIAVTDLWTWNSLLCGLSQQGNDPAHVFQLFQQMIDQGVRPNELTFTHLLNACSHSGLTNRGNKYLGSMTSTFGVTPDAVHYNTMIDILARANYLDEAVKVLQEMPFEANVVSWTSVLSACQKWTNSSVGKLASESLLKLDDRDSTAYLLLSNTLSECQ